MDILDRFINYARIDTQSSEESEKTPSTEKQWNLARLLEKELKEMGAEDVRVSEKCYVYARIPSNLSAEEDARTPKLGFIAHMDTSPEASDESVNPRLIENYAGGDIELGNGEVMEVKTFPQLKDAVGHSILVTDGRTLLGADDKAGVAEIMSLADRLLSDKSFRHGEILIGFTPDEEIGRGADFFDVEGFGAEVAYTVDGGTLGEVEYENFNAASAEVIIKGVNVHPGSAKDKMINASLVAMQFNDLLPGCIPANTEGYEGFIHLTDISGDPTGCRLKYIIRDHDREKFETLKKAMEDAASEIAGRLDGTQAGIELRMKDSYYNMKEKLADHMYLVDIAMDAFRKADVAPKTVPIRGGTDGARLSYMGLPCPNLSTGGENYHGIYEYLNVDSMRTMQTVLANIVTGMIGVRG